MLKWTLIVLGALGGLVAAFALFMVVIANPRVVRELQENPEGARAAKAMLLTLPSGRQLPCNYLREGAVVYVGVDGRWWREFVQQPAPVQLLIKGATLRGNGQLTMDDMTHVHDVFSRLRPTTPRWLPDWMNGKLVTIRLAEKP